VYADAVVAFTDETGAVTTCMDGLGCPPGAACTAHPAVGAPDMASYELFAGGRIELAFFCSFIQDIGGVEPTVDLQIWADVPDDARAVVAVSADGTSYFDVNFLEAGPEELTFDIERSGLDIARFVRVSQERGAPIRIDAVEAF
jgi:hypothetical protein